MSEHAELTLRPPPEVLAHLDEIAAATARSHADLAQEALELAAGRDGTDQGAGTIRVVPPTGHVTDRGAALPVLDGQPDSAPSENHHEERGFMKNVIYIILVVTLLTGTAVAENPMERLDNVANRTDHVAWATKRFADGKMSPDEADRWCRKVDGYGPRYDAARDLCSLYDDLRTMPRMERRTVCYRARTYPGDFADVQVLCDYARVERVD